MKTVVIYQTQSGQRPFDKWLSSIKDKVIEARITARIGRLKEGNFGDTKSVGAGVMELRFFFGSGYRVYYGLKGNRMVILLMGGDKSTQAKDIKLAHFFWSDYLERNSDEKNL